MPVTRRTTALGLTSALALCCPLVAGTSGAAAAELRPTSSGSARAATGPPDIVIILTDDQPVGMLDVMPSVRSMIQDRGVTFTRAIVPTPLCAPSRATLLTGLLPNRTTIYSNAAPSGGWQAFNNLGLEKDTLATWLNGAGYRTALVGKYINDFGRLSPAGYVPPGWDRFAGMLQHNSEYYNYGVRVKDVGGVSDVSYGNAPEDYSTDVLASYAGDIISSTPASTPLFLMYAPVAPHSPARPSPQYAGSVPRIRPTAPDYNERDMSDKPAWMQSLPQLPWPSITRRIARQKETLRSVDDAVATIVSALGPRADNTLFVYMSDNGYLNGSHRLTGKTVAYRRASQVPLIIRWDGHVRAATTDAHVVSTVDVTSTVLDAAGVQQSTDGYPLLGTQRRTGAVIEAAGNPKPAFCAWRTRRWMYIEYSKDLGRDLYDYRNDPNELHNLAADPRYRQRLLAMRAAAKAACSPTPPRFTW